MIDIKAIVKSFRQEQKKIIILSGATATGKSSLAMRIATMVRGVIINCDSMQVYQELPILTSSPSLINKKDFPHLLYHIKSCDQKFSVKEWLNLAVVAIKKTLSQDKVPIVVGGTGMYIKAMIDGLIEIPDITEEIKNKIKREINLFGLSSLYQKLLKIDEITGKKISLSDKQRIARAMEVYYQTSIPLSQWLIKGNRTFFERNDFFIILLSSSRDNLYQRINDRFLSMIEQGVIEEVMNLPKDKNHKAIGFKEINLYLQGKIDKNEMISKTQKLTRNYAKRQMTWFRHQISPNLVIEQ